MDEENDLQVQWGSEYQISLDFQLFILAWSVVSEIRVVFYLLQLS
jgi:hypothetical protein